MGSPYLGKLPYYDTMQLLGFGSKAECVSKIMKPKWMLRTFFDSPFVRSIVCVVCRRCTSLSSLVGFYSRCFHPPIRYHSQRQITCACKIVVQVSFLFFLTWVDEWRLGRASPHEPTSAEPSSALCTQRHNAWIAIQVSINMQGGLSWIWFRALGSKSRF